MSLSELPREKRYALYNEVNLENRSVYHRVSCRPITKAAEDDMELLSDIVTWGEQYLRHSERGFYACSQCRHVLYSSEDKFEGPCRWPSFRKCASSESLLTDAISDYNGYTVDVNVLYCSKCSLFVGHSFRDGRCYDHHADAEWRH